jgi:hypothetical protein
MVLQAALAPIMFKIEAPAIVLRVLTSGGLAGHRDAPGDDEVRIAGAATPRAHDDPHLSLVFAVSLRRPFRVTM